MSTTLAVVLVAWAIVSLICQPRTAISKRIRAWDRLGLIPTWTFFAPNPVRADHYLYYRDHNKDAVSPWRRAFSADRRRIVDPLWSPLRREEKVITDAMFHLMDVATVLPKMRLHFSLPYLALLTYVTGLFHDEAATATQFLIGIKYPDQDVRPVFVSNIHILGEH